MCPTAHLRISGEPFSERQVLSVSVVLSACRECHGVSNDVLNDLFCAVSLSGTMQCAVSVLLEKTAFGENASLNLADPCLAIFLEHPTAACPRSVIHAGQKCPQLSWICRSWMLNGLCLELVPQQKVQGRDLENTVVETRRCRATLSCRDHKRACKRATARCPRAIKTFPGSVRAA